MRPKFLSSQTGSAITSALMGVAISSIVILAVSEMLNLSFKGQKKSELKLDKLAIARQLMEVIDCPKSFAVSKTCTPGDPTELRDSKNRIVVSKAGKGTKFGSYTVKGECAASGVGVKLKAALLSSSGTLTSTDDAAFMPDPLTNKISTWSDKSTFLFPEQTTTCANSSSSNAISSDYILIEERMPWGTDGGPCSPARTWITRKMNTEVSDLTESLTVNGDGTFTLEQGTYECILTPVLQETGRSRARLFDETNGKTIAYSQSMYISIASPTVTIKTKFTISDPTKFSLQVNCEGWGGGDGMGVNVKTVGEAGNVPETYAQVECLRFAK